jgi:thioredoxin 1
MLKLKRLVAAVALLVCTAWPAVAVDVSPAPAIIKQLPPETELFIVIPKVSSLNKSIKMVADKLGLPLPAEPLALFKAQANIDKGMDEDGAVAIAFTKLPIPDPNNPGAGGKPQAIALIPVTDYKAFLGNFGGAEGAAVAEVQLGGTAAFIKQSGKFAVIGDDKGIVENYKAPAGDNGLATASGLLGLNVLGTSDVIIYIDIAKLGPSLQPVIKKGIEQIKAQMKAAPGPGGPMVEAWMNIYASALDAILRDGSSVAIGVDMTDNGVGFSYTAQFKAGSPLFKMFGAAPSRGVTLNRLPARPFLLATAMDLQTLPIKSWLKDIAAATPADNPLGTMLKNAAATMELVGNEVQQAYYAPSLGGAGPPSFNNSVSVYPTTKPKELLAAQRQMLTKLNDTKVGEGITYKTAYTENVMQVGGLNVDKFSLKVDMAPEMLGQLGPAAMLLGQDMGGYLVATDGALVMATGVDPVQLKEAIDASGGKGQLDQNPGIVAVRPSLMPHRVAESYLGVGTIMQFVQGMMAMFAPGQKFDIPADLPPVGISASVAAGGVGARIYVPMTVMVTVKKTVDQVRGGFNNPGAAEAPEPAADAPAAEPAKPAVNLKNLALFTDANFAGDVMKSDKLVVVHFWATWCEQCKPQDEVLAKMADENPNIKFGKIDIDKNPKTADKYEVDALPTVILIKNGKVVQKLVGITYRDKLDAAVKKASP